MSRIWNCGNRMSAFWLEAFATSGYLVSTSLNMISHCCVDTCSGMSEYAPAKEMKPEISMPMERLFTSSQFRMPPTRTDCPQKLLYARRSGRSYLSKMRITFLSITLAKNGFSVLDLSPLDPLTSSKTKLQKSGEVGKRSRAKALMNSVNESAFSSSIPFPGTVIVNTPAKSTTETALVKLIQRTLHIALKSAVPLEPLQPTKSSWIFSSRIIAKCAAYSGQK
mmetsp:Transcript_11316/g.25172  ORF Transcript_11316/g.25172 Transcript_11316/m.25172 type:complete len:223 (+) Transcript_11316:2176-2844(+)